MFTVIFQLAEVDKRITIHIPSNRVVVVVVYGNGDVNTEISSTSL